METGDHSPLKRGQWVRVAFATLASVRKDKMRKKYLQQWSNGIYRIVGVSKRYKDALYNLRDEEGQLSLKTYYRNELLVVDKAKLIKPTLQTSIVVGIEGQTTIKSRVRK